MIKFKKLVQEIIEYEAEYNGAVITIDVVYCSEKYFVVHLVLGAFKIELGCFESLAEARRYIKNGTNQIDNIIGFIQRINNEVLDFKCEPE